MLVPGVKYIGVASQLRARRISEAYHSHWRQAVGGGVANVVVGDVYALAGSGFSERPASGDAFQIRKVEVEGKCKKYVKTGGGE